MESLSELDLSEQHNSESLYADMAAIDEIGKSSRPASTASLSSWTFSPIQEDQDSDIQEQQHFIKTDHPVPATHQHGIPSLSLPISDKKCNQSTVNVVNQHHHQHNNKVLSEYNFPNAITYHHSVNIHNYVGNYCVPQPLWKEACMWEGLGRSTISPMPNVHHDHNTATMPKPASEQMEPLSTIANPNMEFTRCSTPEYLMALNSLHQLDSPPKPNHSAAMNFSCSSFNDSVGHNGSVKHDSGYNSDLNCSPVIQYQSNNAKVPPQSMPLARQTSTPNPYQQYFTIAPLQLFQNENMLQSQNRLMPQCIAMLPGFCPKNQVEDKPQTVQSQTVNAMDMNNIQVMNQRLSAIKAESKNHLNFKSVADYQKAKKLDSQTRKKSQETKPAPNSKPQATVTCDSTARRRHNEPLSNQAIQVMSDWYQAHSEHPYPSKAEKDQLAKDGGITLSQVKSWFANKRNRSNNTRPKKQKIAMEARLLDLCHQLARDARKPDKDNAYYIQQLSSIMANTNREHEYQC